MRMVFACQENSFLRQYKTCVVSCQKSTYDILLFGKKTRTLGYDIIFENTILFPEGGGQPHDFGTLLYEKDGRQCEIVVLQVLRKGSEALHFVEYELEKGQIVEQIVDWERRLDHMQQHSGQHLITAIAEKEFGCGTVSWWLGQNISHIELDTPEFNNEKMEQLERIVNKYIFDGTPVNVKVYDENDPELKEVRTRGLPEDHKGPVRVVSIQGVDNNMCCGTHVTNLCQLQCIKLIGVEKGKGKTGHCLLQFLAGERVVKHMTDMLKREQALTSILNNSPAVHVDLVTKLKESLRLSNKNMQTLLKDLAVTAAAELKKQNPKPLFFSLHRREGDMDFMNTFVREVNDQDILLFLTVGEEKGPASMMLAGKPELVEPLGLVACAALEAKGAGKGSKFQARVKSLENRDRAVELLRERVCQEKE